MEYGRALLFLLCVVAAFHSGEAASAQEEKMNSCQPRSCGNGPNVSYPFWIDGVHPPYCGMPIFKINCDGGYPMLPISGDNYTVHNISYDRATMELTKRVTKASTICTDFPNRNLTLERTPFSVPNTSNTSLFFFFHCNLTLPLLGVAPLRCDRLQGAFLSFVGYSLLLPQPEKARLLGACSTVVNLPIAPLPLSLGAAPSSELLLDFRITLNWKASRCAECVNSGGRCGTNLTDNSTLFNFICICRDRDHRVSCNGRKEQNIGKIIGYAVGSAGGLLVLAGLVVFFLRRFKPPKRSASLSKLIRNTSCESYSMEKDMEALSSQTHIFSYKELEEATEGFADINELGDGGFGTVYKGKLRDGRVVAIKRLYENNFKREEQFLNEVAILNRLRHKNLVSLYGCTSRHSRGLLLVYEYVPNGTVADHLHGSRVEDGALTWPVRMNIAVETAGALTYLHAVEPQIIHRDVKTNNILLDENYHVKVADFGLSRLFPPDATHVSTVPQGTPGYLDPEYHQCYQLTDKSDVYSFGVVLAELISSKPAVDITRKRNEINLASMAISRIQNCQLQELVDPLLGYDSNDAVRSMIEQVAELAFRCLQAEKEMRPSMEEVLEVLKGITGAAAVTRSDHSHLGGKVDPDRRKFTDDCASLLNGSVQYSPDTVHADWASRTTTPNTSGQTLS